MNINKANLLGISFVLLLILFGLMVFRVGAGNDFVYVDMDHSGTKDGSSSNPFTEIQDAVDKARDEDKDVYIREGDYEENIKLWEDVEIIGSDEDEVEIKASDDDEPVIKMYDDTEIHHLTLKDGQYGVLVNDGSKAYIGDCIIMDNEDDGIYAEEAKTDDDHKLEVRDSFIAYNGWNGIYLEERKFSIKDNEIFDNDGDGVEFEDGSEGSFEDNRVKDNGGVGLRLTIDDSELYIKDNTFRDNDKSGLEIDAKGEEGYVSVDRKNKFYKNDRYGIVRVEKAPFSNDSWYRSLKIHGVVSYWDNDLGSIPRVFRVY